LSLKLLSYNGTVRAHLPKGYASPDIRGQFHFQFKFRKRIEFRSKRVPSIVLRRHSATPVLEVLVSLLFEE